MKHPWSNGYVTDLPYSHGYYHELAPGFLRFFLLMNGLADPTGSGGYRYCELGYGQGVSANVHAAANPRGQFWGTDFNPDHALFAQGLARSAGVAATWLAQGFAELLEADLPEFDLITLHGVWSWVDPADRHALVEFIRRRLKVGGVVYVSYNILPGWSAEQPLRDLLWLHTETAGARGASTAARIQEALAFAQRLRRARAGYFEHNPKAGQMLDDMLRDDVQVVAHEYFNRVWHVTYFSELAQALAGAGLSFAASVHKSDLLGEVLQRRQACGLADLAPDAALRETTTDFLLNRRFRRDLFVRGAQRLSPRERADRLREVSLVLLRPASAVSAVAQTPYGSVALDPEITARLVSGLADAGTALPLGRLVESTGLAGHPRERVFETAAALVAQLHAFPVFPQDAACADQAREQARAMNRAVAGWARDGDTVRYLASPVTGHGVEASRLQRLFLPAWEAGARTAGALQEAVAPWGAGADTADPAGVAGEAAQFIDVVAPAWQRLGLLAAQDRP